MSSRELTTLVNVIFFGIVAIGVLAHCAAPAEPVGGGVICPLTSAQAGKCGEGADQ